MSDETLKAYDAIAEGYESYSMGRSSYLESVENLTISYLKPSMRFLDIGAGDGRRLSKIVQRTGLQDVVAIEPSKEMARLCREKTNFSVYEAIAEDIDQIDIGHFDAICALWNVFGHIGSSGKREQALRNIREKLKPEGFVMLDVNNRHNAAAYGRWNVFQRYVIDYLFFDESRGDARYEWKIGEKSYQGFGHLFVPHEIESLFREAGFKVKKRVSVNYATGAVSNSPYKGQLFYIIQPI